MRTCRAPVLVFLASLALGGLVGPAAPVSAASHDQDTPSESHGRLHAAACLPAPFDHGRARIGTLPGERADGGAAVVGDALSDDRRRTLQREIDRRVALIADGPTSRGARSLLLPLGVNGVEGETRGSDLTVRVPVHVHVVDGERLGDAAGPGPRRVQRQIDVLNRGFAGEQSTRSTVAPFRFHIASYERVVRTAWHRAAPGSRVERRMKTALNAGGLDELDLYFTEPEVRGGSIALGSANFPWEAERAPAADGVVLHTAGMPGGDARGYARGDSAVHEVGHWLGLFHTFEGGCGGSGDMVDDTPREAVPSFRCQGGRDTCPTAKGDDPVHNFMDYSLDRCMDRFTPDQVDRMSRVWLAYRAQ